MLSNKEILVARTKVLRCKGQFEQEIGGGCLKSALELYEDYSGGLLCWIGNLTKLDLDFGLHHTYFIPPGARENHQALNHSDKGFGQYPPFTVREARELGEAQDPRVIRQMLKLD